MMGKYRIEPLAALDLVHVDYAASDLRQEQAYLYFDPIDGRLWTETLNTFERSGIPMKVYHGVILRWALPASTNGEWLTQAINDGDFDELFDRIKAGHACDWDGSNWVGGLNRDAEDAYLHIESMLERFVDYNLGVWWADEWLADVPDDELGINAETTDEELEKLAEEWDNEAASYGARLRGTHEYLVRRRDELKQSEEED